MFPHRRDTLEIPYSPLKRPSRTDRIDRQRNVRWQDWPDITCQQGLIDELDPESNHSDHPDLEDSAVIAWGLKHSESSKGERVEVDVLYGEGTNLRKVPRPHKVHSADIVPDWPCNIDDDELSRVMTVRTTT
jgi:hypothetical protein